jgi:uncharacterized protein YuzE
MKVSYDSEADVLMVRTGKGKVDYGEEMGPMIVHFTRDGKPVLLEILDARETLARMGRAAGVSSAQTARAEA